MIESDYAQNARFGDFLRRRVAIAVPGQEVHIISHLERNMNRRLHATIFAGILAFSALGLLSGHQLTTAVEIDGGWFEARAIDGNVVVEDFEVRRDGIDVRALPDRQVDVLFEPVDLAPGETFTAAARDHRGVPLATMALEQTGERTTNVSVSLDGVIDRLGSQDVRLRARAADGTIVREFVVPAANTIDIGEVQSTSSAWAKTYHIVCMLGECSVAIDPDDTRITFEAAPEVSVPFRFLEVAFSVSDDGPAS